jgi:hypothetical protein
VAFAPGAAVGDAHLFAPGLAAERRRLVVAHLEFQFIGPIDRVAAVDIGPEEFEDAWTLFLRPLLGGRDATAIGRDEWVGQRKVERHSCADFGGRNRERHGASECEAADETDKA